MKTIAQKMGRKAEDLAVCYLKKKRFVIKARNYRHKRAEIDIIAKKGRLLVFTEVKARSDDQFGDPETFVSTRQKDLIRTAAAYYMLTHQWKHAIRFDIIAILAVNNQLQLTHFEDAF
ncbi:MAG: YraN family protein [Bacteroidota bacterium]